MSTLVVELEQGQAVAHCPWHGWLGPLRHVHDGTKPIDQARADAEAHEATHPTGPPSAESWLTARSSADDVHELGLLPAQTRDEVAAQLRDWANEGRDRKAAHAVLGHDVSVLVQDASIAAFEQAADLVDGAAW